MENIYGEIMMSIQDSGKMINKTDMVKLFLTRKMAKNIPEFLKKIFFTIMENSLIPIKIFMKANG